MPRSDGSERRAPASWGRVLSRALLLVCLVSLVGCSVAKTAVKVPVKATTSVTKTVAKTVF